jgi:hypothetical protein
VALVAPYGTGCHAASPGSGPAVLLAILCSCVPSNRIIHISRLPWLRFVVNKKISFPPGDPFRIVVSLRHEIDDYFRGDVQPSG